MTNRQVIETFLRGGVHVRHGTMSLRQTPRGIALYSYEEVIALAVREGDHKVIYTNDHRYSLTTAQQMGTLRSALAFLTRTDGYERAWGDFKLPYPVFWREVTREELRELCGLDPSTPPSVRNVKHRTIDAATGARLRRGGGW